LTTFELTPRSHSGHRSISTKCCELIRRLVIAQTRDQFLSHEISRRGSMSPSQSVDVARQALAPQALSARCQPIQSTPWRHSIATRERLRLSLRQGWTQNSDGNGCLLCLVHPAACSSSAKSRRSSALAAVPVESRPGARLPGFRFPDEGDEGIFTCSS
jgi:hypothetical protein